MEQDQSEIIGRERLIDRLRTNLHRTDSDEYFKRAMIDFYVLSASMLGVVFEALATNESPNLLWFIPAGLGLVAGLGNGLAGAGPAKKREREARVSEAVGALQEKLSLSPELKLGPVEGYQFLQDVAGVHGVNTASLLEAFNELAESEVILEREV